MAFPKSPNFQFLKKHEPHLLRLAVQAEAYCFSEPDLSITRLRQLIEAIAASVTQRSGGIDGNRPDLLQMIRELEYRSIISREMASAFHTIRKLGNQAVHDARAEKGQAFHALKLTRAIAIWFHRLNHPNFPVGSFVPPPVPVDATDELEEELSRLKEALQAERIEKAEALDQAAESESEKDEAEAAVLQAYEDLDAALELAAETEEQLSEAQESFLQAQVSSETPSAEEVKKVSFAASEANQEFLSDLDEAETREIIDAQLRDAGWQADTVRLRYAKGERPVKGENKAIAEWPTDSGPVDYALFVGLQLIAVAEAKKFNIDLPPVLGQARRYATDIDPKEYQLPEDSPWLTYKVPFAFAANGRAYLKQVEEKSGIYFHDLRDEKHHPYALDGWRSPEGLVAELTSDVVSADEELAVQAVDLPGLRYYQREAISEVEKSIAAGQRSLLLAMATGTGKTRTAVSLMYRLIKAKRFRRILFLVDRTELGNQAFENGFEHVKLEALQTFTDIYNVVELGEAKVAEESKVHIATVQSMVRRITITGDDPPPPVDQYDCIIIDECHRGYNLDRDMDDHEMLFRCEADFISKYRRVVEHFHAVKVGLTATPAQHTAEIFGRPVYTYSYREAVIDGFLCDHDPPIRITTALSKHGIKWEKGDEIQIYDPKHGTIDLSIAPDEVLKEVDSFNTQVITKAFNATVCQELADELDPSVPGKTLVFCASDSHADIFVTELKKALDAIYGQQPDGLVAKITGSAMAGDSTLIKRFKNESYPKIVVTVDLLTTGIDVPEITAIVFVRRVKSRILYEQMLGRATRLCPDLFGEGEDKQVFEVFDAVDLYSALEDFSTMKPVVKNAKASISQLNVWIKEALGKSDQKSAQAFHAELVVKVRRLSSKIDARSDELSTRFPALTPDSLLQQVTASAEGAVAVLDSYSELSDWLQRLYRKKGGGGIMVSEHKDQVIDVSRGYGDGREKPEDYLSRFNQWIDENRSHHAALKLVLTAPASLTRKSLKELMLAMDDAGFNETQLQPAWREVKHENCAARLIGYIRAQALGSPLLSFEERVDQAAERVVATTDFRWTQTQQRWLARIVKQIKKEVVVDQDSLKTGAFASAGGYNNINRSFTGKLDFLLQTLHQEIWQDPAA